MAYFLSARFRLRCSRVGSSSSTVGIRIRQIKAGVCHIALAAYEARGNQQQSAGQLFLAALYGHHGEASVHLFALQLYSDYGADAPVRGQSRVVWAVTEGRACAREVDLALMGYTNLL